MKTSLPFTVGGSEWIVITADPTCVLEGYTADYNQKTGWVGNFVYVPALGHTFGEESWDECGCWQVCKVCGWGGYTWHITKVNPTCTLAGYTERLHLASGGKWYSNSIPALGHRYDEPVWDGHGWYVVCNICGWHGYISYIYGDYAKVEAGLVPAPHTMFYPGQSIHNNVGWVQNLGALPAAIQLDLTVEVTLKRDANGYLLPSNNWITLHNPSCIFIELQEYGIPSSPFFTGPKVHPLGFGHRVDNAQSYVWCRGPDGKLYVVTDRNNRLHFAYAIHTNHLVMTNQFLDSVVNVQVQCKAAPIWPDTAAKDIFGFGLDDILAGAYGTDLTFRSNELFRR